MSPDQCRRKAAALEAQAENVEAKAAEKAKRLRAQAQVWRDTAAKLEAEGLNRVPRKSIMGRMQPAQGQSTDARNLRIAKGMTKKGRHRAVQALYDAGLTPASAAAFVGTSRDVLKQAWAKGKQFREMRPEWKAKLAAPPYSVPESVWPTKG